MRMARRRSVFSGAGSLAFAPFAGAARSRCTPWAIPITASATAPRAQAADYSADEDQEDRDDSNYGAQKTEAV